MPTVFATWKSQDTGHRVWPGPFLGAMALGLCVGILSITPAGDSLEQQFGLWLLFHLRGPVTPPPEVVIVAMPRDTGDRISIPRMQSGQDPCSDLRIDQTPPTHRTLGDVPERWNRCHHVELLRRLKLTRPAVVTLDVTFRPRDDIPQGEDRALGKAMRDLGNVVLAQRYKVKRGVDGTPTEDVPVELSPDIVNQALGVAPMPLPQLASNRFDQFWTFKDAGWAAPSLPALALQAYAVDTYPALFAALQRIAPDVTMDLPRDIEELTHDGQLQVHMLQLHSIFLKLPKPLTTPDRFLTAAGPGLSEAKKRKLRALLALYTQDNWHYLNLYGPPSNVRTVHIADVLSMRESTNARDPLGLRDKAVFVGYADNSDWEMLEKFPTVFGSGATKTSGVEIVATAFGNLLDGVDLEPTGAGARFVIALAAGSLTAIVGYSIAAFAGALTVFVAAALYLGIAAVVFSRTQLWLPMFMPLVVATPLGYGYAFGYKQVHFRWDRAALRSILNQSVPPEIVDLLARNASQLGRVKETTQVACVMTDVEGFTTLSTTLTPAQVAELLGEYFEAIFKPVADYGGFVSDLKGDSILAVWTDRRSDPAVRTRVLNACLELREAVDRFNEAHPTSMLPTRIGVHYGVVTLGPIGAPPHFEYRAVGDTVNTSSRVEQLSKDLGTRLLVTTPMIEGLQDFLVRDLGEFPLRGRRNTMGILELIGRLDGAAPEQVQLCARFAEAKAAYDAADLERARAGFQSILQDFPGDGPSAYFLRLVERQG